MLNFQDFFTTCTGLWTTERTYHSTLRGEVERSYTEFRVDSLTTADKQQILSSQSSAAIQALPLDTVKLADEETLCPGFAIAFDTRSEKGEQVSMSLKALFVPDHYLTITQPVATPPLPIAAQVVAEPLGEAIQGFYLRDEGYSEVGAIAGRFTYQPTRQTLEMTTYYRRSVAVDQMRIIAPDLRLRTIVTYQRPEANEPPTIIDLVGFGVERKQVA
ncbi:phycobiliprotein lyase [Stenomitos frigidus]|uniref:Chromophore lyase CpcS/CpeS n=1 Tax=Stenomitos frigidus ULC18 TaxID=2107698 RepID=A0A2T1DZF3_9CYAN|nr:phycobiliprotein lyase [Stenomitos frigidus]PSB25862.1 phycobiliprotein lyase [Stenomitos frigidus ULC18]